MPRLSEATKDVTSCEKRGGGANNPRSRDVRMGQPVGVQTSTHVKREQTQGTETSKYLQEEKIRMIAPVVASERARAQTFIVSAIKGLKEHKSNKDRRNGTRWKEGRRR